MKDYTTNAGVPASPTTHNQTAVPDVDTVQTQDRLQELPDVLEFCKANGFPADLVGRWIWIRFDEKPELPVSGGSTNGSNGHTIAAARPDVVKEIRVISMAVSRYQISAGTKSVLSGR